MREVSEVLKAYKILDEVVLFEEKKIAFKGVRYHEHMPKPAIIISGVKIVAIPQHNDCFSEHADCSIGYGISFDINYGSDDTELAWKCDLEFLRMKVLEDEKEEIGIVCGASSQIQFSNFSEFQEVREKLLRFCEENRFLPPETIGKMFDC